jgi:hypothetical protein
MKKRRICVYSRTEPLVWLWVFLCSHATIASEVFCRQENQMFLFVLCWRSFSLSNTDEVVWWCVVNVLVKGQQAKTDQTNARFRSRHHGTHPRTYSILLVSFVAALHAFVEPKWATFWYKTDMPDSPKGPSKWTHQCVGFQWSTVNDRPSVRTTPVRPESEKRRHAQLQKYNEMYYRNRHSAAWWSVPWRESRAVRLSIVNRPVLRPSNRVGNRAEAVSASSLTPTMGWQDWRLKINVHQQLWTLLIMSLGR